MRDGEGIVITGSEYPKCLPGALSSGEYAFEMEERKHRKKNIMIRVTV